MLREDPGLAPQRRDQPIDTAAMLRAFANGKDVGIRRAQLIVNHDAALCGQPPSRTDFRIRRDPRRDHDHVAFDGLAVFESKPDHFVVAQHALGQLFEMDLDAHPFDRAFKNPSGLRIELLLHQMAGR